MPLYAALAILASTAAAFPFIASTPGVDNSLWRRQQSGGSQPGGPNTCPFNAKHVFPTPVSKAFPYNGARGGLPGYGKGGYVVPDPSDPDHQYIAPGRNDIRGPCPGLNAAANYGFIARDGITNYTEMVDAVQNVYNMGYDLANFLATVSIYLADGDLITSKLSIGCDATSRTSSNPALTGSQPGLDGHNKFEADTSLTRDDYFLGKGDDFSFNGTLFKMMADTTHNYFDLDGLAYYRYLRYLQSRRDNPNFFWGPLAIFTHGAASFVYELFPNGKENYEPNLHNTATFFGAKQNSDGSWSHVPERIPGNWTNRVEPYSFWDVAYQTFIMYAKYPVAFGGNAGGVFIGTDFPPFIANGTFKGANGSSTTPEDFACLFYQFLTVQIPTSLNGVLTPAVGLLSGLLEKIGGEGFKNLGCPIPLT